MVRLSGNREKLLMKKSKVWAVGAISLLLFGPGGGLLLQAVTPDLSLWAPALIQLGGFGLLLWLYYSGKIVNESDADQRVTDITLRYEAQLKQTQNYSDTWEGLARARDAQFADLKVQLDTALKALAVLAVDKKGG